MFALDLPEGRRLSRVTTFAGWEIADGDPRARNLSIRLDGRPHCGLVRTSRPDVAAMYPQHESAGSCGWAGDLVLPAEIVEGQSLRVDVVAESACGDRDTLFSESFEVAEGRRLIPPRERAFALADLCRNPRTGGSEPDFELEGVAHFHPDGDLPVVRVTESGPTHPYGGLARELVDSADGLVLDFGAGIKPERELSDRIVNLDAVHFRNLDVVSTYPTLPFRDQSFALVISQAVFEHLPDPFQSAREIWRVLEPGGLALIDTAFMQPFHGDPSHYFNMTMSGLREVMVDFEVVNCGVQPHQVPSLGWIMQLDSVLPYMTQSRWRDRLAQLREELDRDGAAFDESLGPSATKLISAGVYVVGRKPRGGTTSS